MVQFVFCVHNHQPVGNFGEVFEKTYQDGYLPFIEAVEPFPWFRFCAHYSGPLLEWIQEHRFDFFLKLKRLIDQNRLELLGGGFYEPIFPVLPDADLEGQVNLMNEYLHKQFGMDPQGAWLAERVWEPHLASLLPRCGIQYALLDDFHFKATGLAEEKLGGHFITEDQGTLFRIFPLMEKLRYAIPFHDPEDTIRYLERFRTEAGDRVVVYADDGEKFGCWPKTKEHVYGNGWLRRFLEALDRNRDWVRMVTFSEALRSAPPVGKIYLPACSYREMGGWSMLSPGQRAFQDLTDQLKKNGNFEQSNHLTVGGLWRNFRVKYPESNLMYGRMLQVSRKVNALPKGSPAFKKASTSLYRAQCDDAYWHGVFGGVYLGHLRDAVYRNLIEADKTLRPKEGAFGTEMVDLDLDGREEIEMFNKHVNLFVSPHGGGQILEIDLLAFAMNVQASLARRKELYHDALERAPLVEQPSEVQTIHDAMPTKVADPKAYCRYDGYSRNTLVDHFLPAGMTVQEFDENPPTPANVAFSFKVFKAAERIATALSGRGRASGQDVGIEKEILLTLDSSGFEVTVTLSNLSKTALQARYGLEFNLALLTPFYPESFVHRGDLEPLASILQRASHRGTRLLAVCDRVRGLNVELSSQPEAEYFILPVQTISRSEGGLELNLQSVCLMPVWDVDLEPGHSTQFTLIERFGAAKP